MSTTSPAGRGHYVYYPVAGTLSAPIDDTGLSAGTETYRVVARVTTNAPGNAAQMNFTGKVEVTV